MSVSAALGERRTVDVPAGTLEYRGRGSGPAVVFVHGAAVNGDLWRRVVPGLAEGRRCIAVDLPLGGHTIPVRDGADLSLFGLGDLVASFLEALDLDDVTVVGNDTGGAISQSLVLRRPERVGRLVLTSCDAFRNYPPKAVAYLPYAARARPAMWMLAQSMRLKAAQRLPIAYGWATRAPIERPIMDSYLGALRTDPHIRRDFSRFLRAASRDEMQQASEGIAAFDRPALVVWADGDRFFPREHGRRLAELLPQGRFVLAERSRTFIPEDNPTALVEALDAFAPRVEVQPPAGR